MTRGLIRRDPGELPAEVTGFVGRQRELAASRQPMNVPGEHCCPVPPPLPVPEPEASRASVGRASASRASAGRGSAGRGGRGDAVELFAQRAAAASPGLARPTAAR